MKTLAMAVLIGLAAIGACQTPGRTVRSEVSSVCPTCRTETKTAAIKGLTYSRHTCPSCRTTWEANYGESGDSITVHVCDACRQVVEPCPLCAKQ